MMMMENPTFTIFPAIDLRRGSVVRLKEGDPERQTKYSADPAYTAEQWLCAGAKWLHVVNLDAAFGEDDADNLSAIQSIVGIAQKYAGKVQLGGGIRSVETIESHFQTGIYRAILGTAVIKNPEILQNALSGWDADRIAVSLDARDGLVRVSGWQNSTDQQAVDLAILYKKMGLRWLVYTDIARDGLQTGLNITSTLSLAKESGLDVIASGGVKDWEDIHASYQTGLAGVIVGRALYEGNFDPIDLFQFPQKNESGKPA